ncbi:MAG: hypothetical protein ACK5QX_10585, partial [bacterium]
MTPCHSPDPPHQEACGRDEAARQHQVADAVVDRADRQEAVGVDHLGVERRLLVVAEPGRVFALAPPLCLLALCSRDGRLGIALGRAFHEPVKGFGAIGRVRMIS